MRESGSHSPFFCEVEVAGAEALTPVLLEEVVEDFRVVVIFFSSGLSLKKIQLNRLRSILIKKCCVLIAQFKENKPVNLWLLIGTPHVRSGMRLGVSRVLVVVSKAPATGSFGKDKQSHCY